MIDGRQAVWGRIAGIGYLAIFVLAIHANFAVLGSLPGEDDPAAVAAFLRDHQRLWGLAVLEFLVVMGADVVVAYALWRLARPVAEGLNALSALFRLTYTIANIPVIRLLVEALGWATGQPGAVAEEMASRAAHGYAQGFTLTLGFFGMHLVLLGAVLWQARVVPRLLTPLVMLAGVGYIFDATTTLAFPEFRAAQGDFVALLVILPALLGEGLLMVWLLFGPLGTPREG